MIIATVEIQKSPYSPWVTMNVELPDYIPLRDVRSVCKGWVRKNIGEVEGVKIVKTKKV